MTKVGMSCVEVGFMLLSVRGYRNGHTNFTIKSIEKLVKSKANL